MGGSTVACGITNIHHYSNYAMWLWRLYMKGRALRYVAHTSHQDLITISALNFQECMLCAAWLHCTECNLFISSPIWHCSTIPEKPSKLSIWLQAHPSKYVPGLNQVGNYLNITCASWRYIWYLSWIPPEALIAGFKRIVLRPKKVIDTWILLVARLWRLTKKAWLHSL